MTAREYPDRPIVGVGVVVRRRDQLLLVRRGRPPKQGLWGIPGGAVELGETVFAAAAREVLEETGITAVPREILTVVDLIERDADGRVRFHYALVEVLADWQAGDGVAGDDADAVRWATAGEAMALVGWEETRHVIGLAERAAGRR